VKHDIVIKFQDIHRLAVNRHSRRAARHWMGPRYTVHRHDVTLLTKTQAGPRAARARRESSAPRIIDQE